MKGTRILLVDDFEDAREMYTTYLQFEGFEVLTASTAVEALSIATTESPDLILMDAGLPGMTGWDAIVALKNDERTKSHPRSDADRPRAEGVAGPRRRSRGGRIHPEAMPARMN